MDKTEFHIRFHNYENAAEFYRNLKYKGDEVCIERSRAKTKEIGAAKRKIRRIFVEKEKHLNGHSDWIRHVKIDKASFSIGSDDVFVLVDAKINATGALLLDRQLKRWNCTYYIHVEGSTVVKELAT